MRFGAILLCVGLLSAQSQPAAQDQCRVEGKVLNSVTGQPVARAFVSLLGAPVRGASPGRIPAPVTAATDSEGKFVFAAVAAGTYRISAQRDNFEYVRPAKDEPLTLKPGDRKTDLTVQVAPLGAIAGHVRNQEGDPVSRVQVQVLVWTYTPDGRQLTARNGAQTDDLGEYRIFGLVAGKYFLSTRVRVVSPAAPDETYMANYYPGAGDPSGAGALDLGAGQDMRGVDFTLLRAHAASVRGRIVKPAGSTAQDRVIVRASSDGPAASGAGATAMSDADGAFQLRGLSPGSYTLIAQAPLGGKAYTARRSIQVGADGIDGIVLTLAPPADLSGTVRIEGNANVQPSQVRVSVQGRTGQVKGDWTFTIGNLTPDVYRPTAYAPGDLFLKEMRCGATDVMESGVDLTGGGGCDLAITLSANGGQIEGQVQDDNGRPALGAMVTLLAEGVRRDDLFKVTGSGADGHFKIVGAAPGRYRLYAWEGVDLSAVRYDPDFVKPFETSGRSVQVSEGGRETVDLREIPRAAGQ